MRVSTLTVGLASCTIALAGTLNLDNSRALGNHAAGNFGSPATKPKFRYWLPDASINPQFMADDIAQLAKRGAGGTELLNYFRVPATGVTPSDWDIYGYGAPGYASIVKEFLKAHKAAGVPFDFAGSANGCVPAKKGDPGLSWELFPYSTSINGTFSGKIPGWGKGELISVVTFAVVNVSTGGPAFHGPFGWGKTYPVYTISNASLTDITSLVQPNGSIVVRPTLVSDARYYLIQAFYATQPLVREVEPWSATPKTIFQNGSLATDHLSARGAKLITDFLEDYVLDDESKTLFKEVGGYFWEDSVEIDSYLYWTPGLHQMFQERYKYDLRRYVPLLVGKNGYMTKSWPSSWVLDTADGGQGVLADFRGLLTSLSNTYTDHMTKWSREVLGMEFSGQWGYNFPVDMLQVIPDIAVPEAETLSFNNNIDGFLQFAGPGDLSGKTVLSIELGADQYRAYTQTWSTLLYDAKHAFAGGINQVVIHGAVYSHSFSNTTWPSWTSHAYEYGAPHSRHQPAWDVGYPQALGYLARVQWVLQTGVPKVDVIFWDKQTAQDAFPAPLYSPDDLTRAGYSYEYLSPANFVLDEAYVRGGVFAPRRQAAKLLVLRHNDTVTPQGVAYLAKFAAAGLSIIFYGDQPTQWATADKKAIDSAEVVLKGLLSLPNVHQFPRESLAAKLASVGITPRAQISSNGTWWTRWRETSDGDTYLFMYNDGSYSMGNITFAVIGTPYLLNAWTGDEDPIAQYVTSGQSTTMPFILNNRETVIVKFSKRNLLRTHVVSSSKAVLGFSVDQNGARIRAKTGAAESSSVLLSSGKTVTVNTKSVPAAYGLKNWNLTLEHWLPQQDLYDLEPDAKKVNYSMTVVGPTLQSWTSLGYQNVSGIGYYGASIQWNLTTTYGALLSMPPIAHGVVGTLNGMSLPTFDISNPVVDISAYLVPGANFLKLKVSSTLMNSLGPYWSRLQTVGRGPSQTYDFYTRRGLGPQQNGIIGVVQIIPYVLTQVV